MILFLKNLHESNRWNQEVAYKNHVIKCQSLQVFLDSKLL